MNTRWRAMAAFLSWHRRWRGRNRNPPQCAREDRFEATQYAVTDSGGHSLAPSLFDITEHVDALNSSNRSRRGFRPERHSPRCANHRDTLHRARVSCGLYNIFCAMDHSVAAIMGMRFTCPMILVVLCTFAGEAVAKLAFTADVQIQGDAAIMRRAESAVLTYTLSNTGDEPIDLAFARTIYIDRGAESTLFISVTPATAPCLIVNDSIFGPLPPPAPNIEFSSAYFEPLPIFPSETRQCSALITVSSEADGPFIVRFDFHARGGMQWLSAEPQSIFFNLGTAATPVPTMSSPLLAVLSIMMLSITAFYFRRGTVG
jgi:hypothetical protein